MLLILPPTGPWRHSRMTRYLPPRVVLPQFLPPSSDQQLLQLTGPYPPSSVPGYLPLRVPRPPTRHHQLLQLIGPCPLSSVPPPPWVRSTERRLLLPRGPQMLCCVLQLLQPWGPQPNSSVLRFLMLRNILQHLPRLLFVLPWVILPLLSGHHGVLRQRGRSRRS
jgi:hypothetical protein